jgi:hypothetical protein
MSHYDDEVEDYLLYLCECEEGRKCTWHQRLRQGDDRRVIEQELKDELAERHYQFALKHGFIDPEEA